MFTTDDALRFTWVDFLSNLTTVEQTYDDRVKAIETTYNVAVCR